MKKRWFPAVSTALFAADQMMKAYAEQNLEKGSERKIAGPVVLRRVHNQGMCLNLMDQHPQTVRRISVAAAAVLTAVQLLNLPAEKNFLKKAGFSLMSAGAWSNTFDRCKREYVVDYIGIKCRNDRISGITYNLGDFCLAAGGLILTGAAVFSGEKT